MKRMLVNVNDPEERRIAIVEDGQLQELHVELADRESYLGNIYKGKVVNIEPSIGAAFINFGGTRNGFLHASDVVPGYGDAHVELLDILEGRARLNDEDDGPEAVRSILSDDDDDVDVDDDDEAPRAKRRGKRQGSKDASKREASEDSSNDSDAADDDEAEDDSALDSDADSDADSIDADDVALDDDAEEIDGEESDATGAEGDRLLARSDDREDSSLDDEDAEDAEDEEDVGAEIDRDVDDDRDRGDEDDREEPRSRRGRRGPSATSSAAPGDDEGGEEREAVAAIVTEDKTEDATEDKTEATTEDANDTGGETKRRRRRRRRRRRDEDDDARTTDVASSDDEDAADDAETDAADDERASEGANDNVDAEQVEDRGKTRTRGRRGSRNRRGGNDDSGSDAESERDGDRDAPQSRSGKKERSSRGARDRGNDKKQDGRSRRTKIPIQDLLKKGQEVVVQITKEGIGAKGPTLTTYLSLPGRSLVLMPSLPKCGVSRKIEDERERRRLKRIVRDLDSMGAGGIGFIVRTAGIGKSSQDLERDLEYLSKLWGVVVQRAKATRPPAPLYVESDLVLRTMRDLFSPDIDEVVIDSEQVFQRVKDFVDKLMPRFGERIKHHAGIAPLFHSYGLEESVEGLYQAQVDLKHGSSIVIEQTEALVAIDVNSGRYKPGANLEETAYRTNLEAIPEIVRQLKLRDLGGVIIVDFIDMQQEKHRRSVERRFRDELKGDRARINVGRISIFGTLELTRQRVGPGLKRTVFKTCPLCKGTSLVRTVASKSLSVLRAARALARLPGYERLEIYGNPEVCEFLTNRKRRDLIELEDHFGRLVLLRSEPTYPVDVVHYRFLDGEGREAKVNIPAGLGVHA